MSISDDDKNECEWMNN